MATFERSIKIDAPVDRVWAMMTNPATWGSWFPDCDQVTGLGAVEAGATFQWRDEGRTGSGAITEVDTGRGLIKVAVRDGDREVLHTFDLDQAGGFFGIGGDDTTVKYRKEYDAPGGFLGEFVAGGNPVDALEVKKTLERIRNLAQGG
jgi:uncharacterized protein YndB with AHSA1/START domain